MTGQLSDKKELTWQEWEKMENDNTVLVDLREEVVYHHGSIPGAVCIPLRCFAEEKEKLPKDKCIVVFCQRGEKSLQVVEELRKEGWQAYHLEGGFLRWLIDHAKEVNMERYSRHVLLDEVGQEGQEKLLASKVLVVGAGGLGAPVALYLAAAGVGTIGIVDADVVELSNLQRQIIHNTSRLGQKKVDSAKETIELLNPDVTVKTYAMRLTPENIGDLIEEYDFVVDGVDNFETKFYKQDILGSIAHVTMLEKQKILTADEKETIIGGLKSILEDIESGKLEFTAEHEDIHSFVEAHLIERIGDPGKKLHTGRRRLRSRRNISKYAPK